MVTKIFVTVINKRKTYFKLYLKKNILKLCLAYLLIYAANNIFSVLI